MAQARIFIRVFSLVEKGVKSGGQVLPGGTIRAWALKVAL
jgi:hypothetical protein